MHSGSTVERSANEGPKLVHFQTLGSISDSSCSSLFAECKASLHKHNIVDGVNENSPTWPIK
jgi:hypothetical protein